MMKNDSKVIGLIAGQGALPVQIIEHCQSKAVPIVAIAFENQTPAQTVTPIPHIWLKLGAVGKVLDYLKSQKVTHILMAGDIKRPALSELSLDWAGTKLIAKLGLSTLGDDGLLSSIIDYLEQQGFQVIGATDLLDDLTAPAGCLTGAHPSEDDILDIALGRKALEQLGTADIGQALVIQQGLILGVEAIEGTEQLIQRTKEYAKPGRKPILVKASKPQQNLKVDLPTIGLGTVEQCIQANLSGIAIESGKTQVLERAKAVGLANEHNIFIWGF